MSRSSRKYHQRTVNSLSGQSGWWNWKLLLFFSAGRGSPNYSGRGLWSEFSGVLKVKGCGVKFFLQGKGRNFYK